jgi:hypothetical protein
MTVKYIGELGNPYPYIITVDDYIVPFVRGRKNADGTWAIYYELTSHAVDTSESEIMRWVPLLAEVMANAAGVTFGENSKPYNFFSRRAYGVILDGDEITKAE